MDFYDRHIGRRSLRIRPRPAPRLLHSGRVELDARKRLRMLRPIKGQERGLRVPRPAQSGRHDQRVRSSDHASVRQTMARAQHAGHLLGARRLCSEWSKQPALAPARQRDFLLPGGDAPRGLRGLDRE
ncbi:hypothetical protein KC19_2G231200 [Ceratodon purpureus]|uniref:Uncharacterized protein n=1 Tax=Ceratodon purpureus TaxID=3225 RepID=A0A8T0IZX0_CERPU|nr:hypothetical protein KC19_2G231200 [Ceratodon purpureus]